MHFPWFLQFKKMVFAIAFSGAVTLSAQEAAEPTQEKQHYQVIGQAGPDGAYAGSAVLERTTGAIKFEWNIQAPTPSNSKGFGLVHHQRMGAVFGEQAMGLMMFSLHGKVLLGKAVFKEDLTKVTNLKLELVEGTPYDGIYRFLEGGVGELHIQPVGPVGDKPQEGPIGSKPQEVAVFVVGEQYRRLEGLGLWTGDVLQFAPAIDSGVLGVMSYTLGRDDAFHGVWSSGSGIHLESLKPKENTKPTPDPRGLPFDKQAYFLVGNHSKPGEKISEEREYLRLGESNETFSKKILFRRYLSNQMNANDLAQTLLLGSSDQRGLVSSKLIEGDERLAGYTLLLKHQDERLFNLVYVFRDETHLTSTHLVVRNRMDISSEDKFAEHVQKNLTEWANEVRKLATVSSSFLRVTASMPVMDTEKLGKGGENSNETSKE